MSLRKSDISRIMRLFKEEKSFLIASHRDPEGDALGSSLALANYLLSKKKEVVIFNHDKVPTNLAFLKNSELVTNDPGSGKFDLAIIVDCSEYSRISDGFEKLKDRFGTIINIDHHLTSKGLGSINLIDPMASSASEIIYDLFRALGLKINLDVAEAIYTAILTDTGSFRYSNATPKAFKIASELVNIGVDPWKVASEVYENVPIPKLNLISQVLSTLEIFERERFASITLTEEMIKKTEALPEFTDGLINYPRSLRGIEVAIFFKELGPDHYKVGLRSKGSVDVSKIAAQFGGGGHRNASGCELRGSLMTVKAKVYERAKDAIFGKFGDNPGK